MPFYDVHHSYPLNKDQRQQFAHAITQLYCKAYKTPTFFVHVRFFAEEDSENVYFISGRSHLTSNRISGNVRVSPMRSKEDSDELAIKIEAAWYEMLKITSPAEKATWNSEDEQKRLILVKFVQLVSGREVGMIAPEAGKEGNWLKSQVPHVEAMANKGVGGFADILAEVKGLIE
ncbi:cis-3-chloroacrylic acid [Fusarium acutatum]|uniref:Cis-3-chloroacrylic acid n=1 Tax=Fusarium acutatum TaxID=78861 RepID=A0A8H4JQ22_9HYPO|nr:cis-3-chloroacrylic acid [Fusarium acutatum]